ncbi:MAG: flavodoxin family protein [Gammaproteobacteria bacterium]|jgi:multimeric flavodoxin WrbA|nr:flavodoxin family protein [Gammaproteobacteria bacterium]
MPHSKQLLIISHTPSVNTQCMAQHLLAGAKDAKETQVGIRQLSPAKCHAKDILAADALILLTTENLGYMAGATKDLFDRTYYDVIEATQGLPYALVVRAGLDGTGCTRAVESICSGLRWRIAQKRLLCRGDWQDDFNQDCYELGQLMTVSLALGVI